MTPERKYVIRLNCSIMIAVLSSAFVSIFSFLQPALVFVKESSLPGGAWLLRSYSAFAIVILPMFLGILGRRSIRAQNWERIEWIVNLGWILSVGWILLAVVFWMFAYVPVHGAAGGD